MTAQRRPWSVWPAIPVAVAAVFAGVLGFAVLGLLRDALVDVPAHAPGLTGAAAHGTPPLEALGSTAIQDVVLALGVIAAAWTAGGGRSALRALGLRDTRVGSSVAYVVLGYVVFLVVSAIWSSALSIGDRENVAVDLGTRDSVLALIGGGLVVGALAPIAEELFFRGFLFGALRRHGFPLAAGVSGLLFGAAHVASAPIGFLLPLALLGVILCTIYERTGSLYPCLALHCLNNSVAYGAGDGRGWIVPACLAVCAATLVVVLRGVGRVASAA